MLTQKYRNCRTPIISNTTILYPNNTAKGNTENTTKGATLAKAESALENLHYVAEQRAGTMESGRERGKNKERGKEETEIEEVDRDKCNLIEDD